MVHFLCSVSIFKAMSGLLGVSRVYHVPDFSSFGGGG